MIIKVSFIRDMEQISALCSSNVDYLAFDFCSSSDRFFAQKTSAATYEIPRKIKKVGIFDSNLELNIISTAGLLGLNSVQMDSDQTPQFCEKIASEGVEIIKTFTPYNVYLMGDYEGVCNKFILRGFTLSQILKISTQTPFLVEGDIFLFESLLKSEMPSSFVGFDTGSGFEQNVAFKDMCLVEKLIGLKQ